MREKVKNPRIPLLSADEMAKIGAEAGIPPELQDRNIFRVLFQSPRVAKALQGLLYAQLFGSAFDGRLRELVIMRIGWQTKCEYEWVQHWYTALKAFGCTEQDLLEVRNWQVSTHLGAAEKAVLAATDEVISTGTISDETWALCEQHLEGTEARLELVFAIATWHAVSLMLQSLKVPVEADTPSWPPDGRSPQDLAGGVAR
jgi:alkylhydroperoxidase family enzyme